MNVLKSRIVFLLISVSFSLLTGGAALAQQKNKVVVVPLGGDVSSSQFNDLVEEVALLRRRAPFAYGRVASDGTAVLGAGTANYTSLYDTSADRYRISITDLSFNINRNTALASLVGSSCASDVSLRTTSIGGDLLVLVRDSSGADLQCSFTFTVYRD